ncbi:MAG TPA: phosphoenolpyruvate--protein phosphotransferase, partial [Candidatus Brocadiia bacterium]|nr:phosphoenolpyruvate--protein phosphotransferase [Candidatus Brocadiia bacterium]
SQRLLCLVKQLESAGDPYIAERTKDVQDLERWLLNALLGAHRDDHLRPDRPSIIVAHDLTPAQTVGLEKGKALGFVTDAGGRTSHTAILARTLAIPAVLGLGTISNEVSTGDMLIVDGANGEVILAPDEATIQKYRDMARRHATHGAQVSQQYCVLPAVTTDGVRATILLNIEFPGEAIIAASSGAEGIGLYRTEFLYHTVSALPDEKAHFDAYMEVVRHLEKMPIIIRTLDLGADKFPNSFVEHNPFLGCRSIRLSLRDQPTFRKQIRAILRASVFGDIRIMLPLVTTLEELRQARAVIKDVEKELEAEGASFKKDVKVGIMIEVPSAAIMAAEFAKEADFFSIGTNDLIQYTLAVDRDNETVSHLYSASDPAVLRLIRDTIKAANDNHIPCALCGEMAGDTFYTILLLGLGLTEFSMGPKVIPEVKRVIRAVSAAKAREIAQEALALSTAQDVTRLLEARNKELLPSQESADT